MISTFIQWTLQNQNTTLTTYHQYLSLENLFTAQFFQMISPILLWHSRIIILITLKQNLMVGKLQQTKKDNMLDFNLNKERIQLHFMPFNFNLLKSHKSSHFIWNTQKMVANGSEFKTDSMWVNMSTVTAVNIWKTMESLQFTSLEFMLNQ